jgi:hypothetical protein
VALAREQQQMRLGQGDKIVLSILVIVVVFAILKTTGVLPEVAQSQAGNAHPGIERALQSIANKPVKVLCECRCE